MKQIDRVMKLTTFFLFVFLFQVSAGVFSQNNGRFSLKVENESINNILKLIEDETDYTFMYNRSNIDVERKADIDMEVKNIEEVLDVLFKGTNVRYRSFNRNYVLYTEGEGSPVLSQQPRSISGKVTDYSGALLPGVTVVIKSTTQGTVTDANGEYSLSGVPGDATLVFSFVGMRSQEILVGNQSVIDIRMAEETIGIDEVVAIGYGSMKKSDLTGSVSKADIDLFKDQPNISIVQSLHGSVAGLNVGQTTSAGAEPSITIRGRTSISGEQNPLMVLDGVIFRGNLIDINPQDIGSVDVLKDNSAAAVYGSQAANGVILITSKTGKGRNNKPLINYTASVSLQTPGREFVPGNGEDFINKNIEIDWLESRTPESGYLEAKEGYSVTGTFKTNDEIENYNAGRETNWYDLLTNDIIWVQDHNLSLTNKTDYLNYFISFGYTDQQGYMINDGYKRYNARINVDNYVTDWLTVGVQSFFSLSDYSGLSPSASQRYLMPYEAAYNEDGEVNPYVEGGSTSPLVTITADNLDMRNNYFGNIYANIDIPFIKGLSYKINFSNNYRTNRDYYFKKYANNYQGEGGKSYDNEHDMSSDNIISYKRRFNEKHNLDVTLLYGFEKRKYDVTDATSQMFITDVLGYNSLESGSSELQSTSSGAWEEKSLYSMARLFYSYRNRYMITGTIRRDGFSGFSENNKFGIFPSLAAAWVISDEPFFKDISNAVNYLKFKLSYGSIGNRTVGRYQTLAKVSGGYGYVDASGASVYAKSISSLASTDLKWETTTGINLGIDFGLIKSRVSGSIDYYNNNTKDLLYNVDIPSIGRFTTFPDNLGKIHNHGLEITLHSVNIQNKYFRWNTSFAFSRDRDELKELLGFDNDGDGKEDDLISEGLFIGQPLNVAYHYEVTGELYQLGDDIPSTADIGSQVIVDQNDDELIDSEHDKVILGCKDPSYRFSITNQFSYKNWALSVFINSVQGGKDHYYAMDNIHYQTLGSGFSNSEGAEQHYQLNFPRGLDYWLPENPNARYPRVGTAIASNLLATAWTQRSFVRLQDVSLSYNLKSPFIKRLNINMLRLFVSGQNLYTWTKWPGWDPETGKAINRDGLPVLKSYTFGLNVEF